MNQQFQEFQKRLRDETRKYLKWYMPNKEQAKINKKIAKKGGYVGKSIRRGDFHNMLQNRLADMATEYGVEGRMEYQTTANNRTGYIDIVWVTKTGKKFIAIEIDTSNKLFSIEKLIEFDAKYCIWINVSNTFDMEKFAHLGDIDLNVLRTESGKEVYIIVV